MLFRFSAKAGWIKHRGTQGCIVGFIWVKVFELTTKLVQATRILAIMHDTMRLGYVYYTLKLLRPAPSTANAQSHSCSIAVSGRSSAVVPKYHLVVESLWGCTLFSGSGTSRGYLRFGLGCDGPSFSRRVHEEHATAVHT